MKKTIIVIIFSILLLAVTFLFFKTPSNNKNEKDKTEHASEEKIEVNQNEIDEYIDYDIIDDSHIKMNQPIYYLALGDSLTKGIGDEQNKKGFTERLVEKIEKINGSEVNLDNRGKRGRRSDQLLKLIEEGHYDEEIKMADLITITIGGNDIMKIVKQDLFELEKQAFDDERVEFEERLKKVVDEIHVRNDNVPIVLIGVYNPFTTISDEIEEFNMIVDEWNETIENIADETPKACYVKIQDLFDTNANMVYHSDFFHPNSNGYTMMTERILLNMMECHILKPNQIN